MEAMVGGRAVVAGMPAAAREALRAHAVSLHARAQQVSLVVLNAAEEIEEGFIYVIAHPAWPEFVKIGYAVEPMSRLAGFQTACPKRAFRMERAVWTSNRRVAEFRMHEHFKDRRAEGEWFRIPVSEACAALDLVAERDPQIFQMGELT